MAPRRSTLRLPPHLQARAEQAMADLIQHQVQATASKAGAEADGSGPQKPMLGQHLNRPGRGYRIPAVRAVRARRSPE